MFYECGFERIFIPREVKPPSHDIFVVVGDNHDAEWIKVGAAWPNRDGNGFNLALNAVPIGGGRLVMRAFNERSGLAQPSRIPSSQPEAQSVPSAAHTPRQP